MRDSVKAGWGRAVAALELGAADAGGFGDLALSALELYVAYWMFEPNHITSFLLAVERQTSCGALAPDMRIHRRGRKSDWGDLWIVRNRLRVGGLEIFSGLVTPLERGHL